MQNSQTLKIKTNTPELKGVELRKIPFRTIDKILDYINFFQNNPFEKYIEFIRKINKEKYDGNDESNAKLQTKIDVEKILYIGQKNYFSSNFLDRTLPVKKKIKELNKFLYGYYKLDRFRKIFLIVKTFPVKFSLGFELQSVINDYLSKGRQVFDSNLFGVSKFIPNGIKSFTIDESPFWNFGNTSVKKFDFSNLPRSIERIKFIGSFSLDSIFSFDFQFSNKWKRFTRFQDLIRGVEYLDLYFDQSYKMKLFGVYECKRISLTEVELDDESLLFPNLEMIGLNNCVVNTKTLKKFTKVKTILSSPIEFLSAIRLFEFINENKNLREITFFVTNNSFFDNLDSVVSFSENISTIERINIRIEPDQINVESLGFIGCANWRGIRDDEVFVDYNHSYNSYTFEDALYKLKVLEKNHDPFVNYSIKKLKVFLGGNPFQNYELFFKIFLRKLKALEIIEISKEDAGNYVSSEFCNQVNMKSSHQKGIWIEVNLPNDAFPEDLTGKIIEWNESGREFNLRCHNIKEVLSAVINFKK